MPKKIVPRPDGAAVAARCDLPPDVAAALDRTGLSRAALVRELVTRAARDGVVRFVDAVAAIEARPPCRPGRWGPPPV